ncbi:MAG: LysR family transcriptional regulator [Micrococcales bacterium]|nr:LysR family transcriptional regulator [Micrococcales bacterium]
MIDLHRLRVFRAVVSSGSMNAAATNLGYTPSAVSQQIAALSRETGLALVERSGRGVTPTSDGLRLLELGEESLAAVARLESAVAQLRSGATRPLRIGYFPSAGATWVPVLAKRLAVDFPDQPLELAITEGAASEVVLAQDLNLVPEHVDVAADPPPGFTRHAITVEPYDLTVPAGHPLAERTDVRMEELADVAWVDPSLGLGGPCQQIVESAFASAGFTPRYVAQSDDHYTALGFVAAGLGVSAMPRLAVTTAPAGVVSVGLVDPTPRRRIVAHLRAGLPGEVGEPAVAILREIAAA